MPWAAIRMLSCRGYFFSCLYIYSNRCGTRSSCRLTCQYCCLSSLSVWDAERVYIALIIYRQIASPLCPSIQKISTWPVWPTPPISGEVIQIGDVLEVTMVSDYAKLTTTTSPVRVADDGTIAVPLIGKVTLPAWRWNKPNRRSPPRASPAACFAIPVLP